MNYSTPQQTRDSKQEGYPAPANGTQRSGMTAVVLIVAICLTNAWILNGGGGPLPWIGAVAGFLLALGLPTWMLSQKIDWRTQKPSDRLCYSVVTAILGLLIIGLVINTVLPHVGVARPLDRVPVLVAIDVWCGGLALWRRRRFTLAIPRPNLGRLNGADLTVGSLAALCVPLSVAGANRLNNGASGDVALAMMILAAVVFTLMFANRESLSSGTFPFAIYCIGLALLLTTSLRGWYVTGHDIQVEYRVFELTKSHGFWDMAFDHDGYNSCLSITILPTMLWQMTRVDDPYIYKFWFQLLFALCPVMLYCIAVRHVKKAIAIIAVVFFIAFPTYSTDMTFLNRQEIAFLFVAAAVMVVANRGMSKREVHIWIAVFSIGVVFSHYSTSYVYLGTLGFGWFLYKAWSLFRRVRNRPSTTDPRVASRTAAHRRVAASISLVPAISLANVVLVLVAIGLWDGLATHTTGGLSTTISQAVQSLRGGSTDTSGNVSYGVLSSQSVTPQQVVTAYQRYTLHMTTAQRATKLYYPESLVDRYPVAPVHVVSEANLPVTGIGQLFDDAGLSVSTLNSLVRSLSAKLLQLLVVVGLAASIISRRRQSRSYVELIALSCGALIIVALQVVFPILTVDYGVQRAFLQALIVFGVFVAVGCYVVCRPLGEKWGNRVAYMLALIFFLSLTGVIPQLLGGYGAQLDLNNSGQYYELYYVHPQDESAIQWVQENVPGDQLNQVQSEVDSNRYTFTPATSFYPVSTINDIFPSMLRTNSYVYLGYTNVAEGQASFSYDGQTITYTYPYRLLRSTRDLLYSSNGAEVWH